MAQGFSSSGNIVISGGVDPLNSSTSVLTAGSTFTGTWVDVSTYPSMVVAVATDQDGTFTIQYSPDGTNVDSTLTKYYRTALINPPHSFVNSRKYMRVTFTNTSASPQTYFRLQTMLGAQGQLNAPIDGTLSQNFDAYVVRPTDYNDEVVLNRRQGATAWNKFGYNDDVDIGTEVVWSVGGSHTIMTTARTMSVVSTSIQDDVGGTGATYVIIYGINASRLAQTVVLEMNGTTPAVTTETWLGINRIAVYLCGSSNTNVGTITATATTDATVQGQIPIGVGTTQQCIFFTQDNHQVLIKFISLSAARAAAGTNPKVTFKLWVYSFVSQSKYEVLRKNINTDVSSELALNLTIPLQVGEKSVIWFEATTDQNNTSVTARFSLLEIRDINA